MVWSGEIGNVTEVHAWTNRPIWPQGLPDWPAEMPVPDTMAWDLWLGISSPRAYNEKIAPFNWRGFFEYGCGSLGDMACHILGAPNMALKLGSPTSVECVKQEGKSQVYFPSKSALRFDFPARGDMPAVKIFWYDAMKVQPEIPGVPAGEILGDLPRRRGGGQQGQRPEQAPQDPRVIGQVFTKASFEALAAPPQREQSAPQEGATRGDSVARREAQINRAANAGSNGSPVSSRRSKGFITTQVLMAENTCSAAGREKMRTTRCPPSS